MKKYMFIFIIIIIFTIISLNFSHAVNEYKILVDIEYNKLYLLKGNICLKTYDVSSGKYSTPSPLGTFKIISKDTWGDGFGGHWMGFNVPWGKYGIHGTNEPYSIGHPASHGCIRMKNNEVRELYNIVPHGTKVVISGGPFGPFNNGFRVLKPGNTGSDVFEVQKRLKDLGYFAGYINGTFDKITENAIYKIQQANGLPKRNIIGWSEYNAMNIYLIE